MSGTVAARLMRIFMGAAGALGGDINRIAEGAGIELAALADDDLRLPHAVLLAFWREAARSTGDDALGLHVAEIMRQHSPANVLAYAVHSSATLGEAFRRSIRYAQLIHGGLEVVLTADDALARLRVLNHDPLGTTRHGIECALATAFFLGRTGIAAPFTVRKVSFRHAQPASIGEHERIFAAPLGFGAEADELVFDRALVDLPMVRADSQMGARLERILDELGGRVGDVGFLGRVRRAVGAHLQDGLASVDDVAARLGLSTRSLQRRLRESGTSFQELADTLRRELALRYLADPSVSIAEVTFLVGFAEVSGFHRAFRRWTGRTPAEHRGQRTC